jgi:phage gpG-like protein
MSFKTTFKFSRINGLERAFKSGIRQGLQTTNIQLIGKGSANSGLIKAEMNKHKTGTLYPVIVRRGVRYLNHRASNKSGNESSAILSGQLRQSLRGNLLGANRLEISANTPYAALQENGGRNGRGVYVAPRNNLKRPINQSRRDIINNIDNSIRSSLK